MSIRSTSLFHYTSSKGLYSILKQKRFRPSYCKELNILSGISGTDSLFIPIVCFCDLRISEVKIHYREYSGKQGFAIGLRKGFNTEIVPLQYWQRDNGFHKTLKSLGKEISGSIFLNEMIGTQYDPKRKNVLFESNNLRLSSANDALKRLSYYTKPYESRNGKIYYHENEWRWLSNAPVFPYYNTDEEEDKLNLNKQLHGGSYEWLKFEYNDIEHLIVHSEDNLPKLVRFINKLNENRSVKDHLLTKITTLKSIINDY